MSERTPQRTPVPLDEPTPFLDITHQYRLLTLLTRLRDEGCTVVAELHDINQEAGSLITSWP